MSDSSSTASTNREDDGHNVSDTNGAQQLRNPENKPKKKSIDFISKNIKLVADGMGALAITDEEKQHLSDLLCSGDSDEAEREVERERLELDEECDSVHTAFKLDSETNALLQCIDLKLQELKVGRGALTEASIICEHEEEVSSVYEQKNLKLKYRLLDIERTLRNMEESAAREVEPVPQEEISKILEEYYSHVSSATTQNDISADQHTSTSLASQHSALLPREALNKVVQDAKNHMPLFQFKY